MSQPIELQETSAEDQKTTEPHTELKTTPNAIILPKAKRLILFVIMLVIYLFQSIEHGTIPAATKQIRIDLDISDTILGLFGSAVYAGTIIGSLLSLSLINLSNRKYLVIFSTILSGVCLLLFTIKQHFVLLFINRGFVGLFQTFFSIYLPVWCDQFGEENLKTMMIAILQVASPLGIVLGFALTTVLSSTYGWKMSFIIEAISTISLAIVVFLFDSNYFKSSIRQHKAAEEKETAFYDETTLQSTLSSPPRREEKSIYKLLRQFKVILQETIFIFSVLTLSTLMYIATSIQYWASDYMLDTLHVEDEKKRLACFVIICLTSPTMGVLMGGIAISCVGGYESKRSTPFCLGFCIVLMLFSLPIPVFDSLLWCTVCLWLLLFFGGSIVASLRGIIITSVPKDYAGSANSICHLLCNIIGTLPAPYVYGTIKSHCSGRMAMLVAMWISILAVIFLAITTYLRSKHYDRIQKYAKLNDYFKHNIETDVRDLELSQRNKAYDDHVLPENTNNPVLAEEKGKDAPPV